jgi:RHS repeat-associated protein
MGSRSTISFICLIGLLIFPLDTEAKTNPSVAWNPARVEQTLEAGGKYDLLMTFTTDGNLANANLWIVPELRPFISLEPVRFSTIKANTAYQVIIHSFAPANTPPGLYEGAIHLRESSKTYPQTLKVSLNIVHVGNRPPVANAGQDQNVTVGDLVTLDGRNSFDPDGDLITYNWTMMEKPLDSAATLTNPTSVMPTFVPDKPGNYLIALTVSDGQANSTPDDVMIIAARPNVAPTANGGPDQSVVIGSTVFLDGTGSFDPDGDPLTYLWQILSLPAGSTASLDNPASPTPSFMADKDGQYIIQLTVNDGELDSLPDDVVVISATPNAPPIAFAGNDQTVSRNTIITLDGTGSSDPNNDPLTYAWSIVSTPNGSTSQFDNPASPTPKILADMGGEFVFRLVVSDGQLNSNPDTVVVAVTNDPPVANAGPDREGIVGTTINLDGSGSSDPNGDQITYQWALFSSPSGSIAAINNPTSKTPSITPDLPGTYTIQLVVNDGQLNSAPDTVLVNALVVVPNVVGMTQADAQAAITGAHLVVGTVTTVNSLTVPAGYVISQNPLAGSSAPLGSPIDLVVSLGPPMVLVPDVVGMTQANAGATIIAANLTVGTITTANSPTVPASSVINQNPPGGTFVAQGSAVGLVISLGPAMVIVPNVVNMTQANAESAIIAAGLIVGTITSENHGTIPPGNVISQNPAGGSSVPRGSSVNLVISLGPSGLPPDPSTVAPPLDPTVVTPMGKATEFLYTGPNPIQTGVAPGTIEARRAAVLRGKVLNRDGNVLSGVTISILNHPEFGQTLSRADGMFDLAVNGGGPLTINYQKTGYLPAQRQLNVPWQDYAIAPDVALISLDPNVTAITANASIMQVHQSTLSTDIDGSRKATLLFPAGATATMVMPDGTNQPLSNLNVRATEYTIGPNGQKAMPALLPPASGYTYAVELSVDEALAAGATEVRFDRPVLAYLENFLNFPVGGIVPSGFYDRTNGRWVASDNGRIVKFLSVTPGGLAELDIAGLGMPASAAELDQLSVTDAERQRLATLYVPGQSLWRVPLTHFSPGDWNWPYGPPPDAEPPSVPGPQPQGDNNPGWPPESPPTRPSTTDNPCVEKGSIIECESQVLGEAVDIAGTTMRLHYRSDRVPGNTGPNRLEIPLTGASVPASLTSVELSVAIAGKYFTQSFSTAPNQSYTFEWDGQDAYGRPAGGLNAMVMLSYLYPAIYGNVPEVFQAFNEFPDALIAGIKNIRADFQINFHQNWNIPMGGIFAGMVGGWSLSQHHTYDPRARVVYLGDGRKRSLEARGPVVYAAAGAGGSCEDQTCGDGGPARLAQLEQPEGLALGPDGSLYIADTSAHRIRRVGTDGIIRTIAGTGTPGSTGDGGPATEAQLDSPLALSVSRNGSIYIVEGVEMTGSAAETGFNGRLRRVSPTGTISTVVAAGSTPAQDPGGPANRARLRAPRGVAVTPTGSLCVSDASRHRVYRVTTGMPDFSASDVMIPSEEGFDLWVFSAEGRHLRTLDALTRVIRYEFSYDANGRLSAVRDVDGNVTTIERDGAGNPTAIVAPFGQRTVLSVDSRGFLSRIANPNGNAVQFAYTGDGLLTTRTDPRGGIPHRFYYDADGRLIRDEDPAGGVKTVTRSQILRRPEQEIYQVAVTTALGRTTTYKVTNWESGGSNRVITDPSGHRTLIETGVDGSRRVTYPDGTVETTFLGPDPRWGMLVPVAEAVTRTIPGGPSQTIRRQRTVTLADPDQPLSLQTWTETLQGDDGRVLTTQYVHGAAPTLTTISPAGRMTTVTLDDRSRPVQVQPDGLAPIAYAYDLRGHLTSATVGNGAEARQTTFSYDSAGLLAVATEHLGRSVTLSYDASGQVVSQTNPDTGVVGFGYDANGNLTALTPPERTTHGFSYTLTDLMATYTPPDVGLPASQTGFTYNVDQQLIRLAQPGGQTVDLAYDQASGRLASLTTPRGLLASTYSAMTGQKTGVSAPSGIDLALSYLGAFLSDETWSGPVTGSVSRTYDSNLRVTSRGVNGASVSVDYDADDLLIRAGSLTLARDAQTGLITGLTLGGNAETLTYNVFGERISDQVMQGPTSLFGVEYVRDGLGRIVEKRETLGGVTDTHAYGYDQAGRLAEVRTNGAVAAAYTYDRNGNRLSATDSGGTISASYDAQDRLTQYGSTSHGYAVNGDLQQKTVGGQTTQYQYDALANLLGVTLPDGTLIEYLVDGRNRRVGRKVNGVLVQGFLYQDKLRPIAELDGSNNVVSRFVYANGSNVPAYMVKNGVTYRIISDHLGSPRLVVNPATGDVVQRLDYDAFGNVLQDTNPGFQPFGFAGGLYDPGTGLVRFGARDYDSEVGRWSAKDPLGFGAGDPNLYTYVGNAPVNLIDPSGLWLNPLTEYRRFKKDLKDRAANRIRYAERQILNLRMAEGVCSIDTKLPCGEYRSPEDQICDQALKEIDYWQREIGRARNERLDIGVEPVSGPAAEDTSVFINYGGSKA